MKNGAAVWAAVVLAAAVLPVISALTVGGRDRTFAKRWLMCLMGNAIILLLVSFGFAFQRSVDLALIERDPYAVFDFSWFEKIKLYLSSSFLAATWGPIILISLIISLVTLYGKNRRQRAVFGCRGAFLTYVACDIALAIVKDLSIVELIKDVVFDFVGAILFGAAASVLLSIIFGEGRLTPAPFDARRAYAAAAKLRQ